MIKYKKGDLVYIKFATWSNGKKMDDMIGTIGTVEHIKDEGNTLLINDYLWHHTDVDAAEVEEAKPKIFHFDVSSLKI